MRANPSQGQPFSVGIDYRPAHRGSSARRGIGAYTRQLTATLSSSLGESNLYLCASDPGHVVGLGNPVLVNWPARPSRMHWIWDACFLRRKLEPFQLRFFHVTDPVGIPGPMEGTKLLMHLHDVIPFIFWEHYSRQLPWDFKFGLRRSLKLASRMDAIITDSECSKRDILRWTAANPQNVHVVPFGCDDAFKPEPDAAACEAFRGRKGITSPYLLYVGATDFRKNVPFLVRAFARAREAGYSGSLYLLGEELAWDALPSVRAIKEEIARSRHADAFRLEGYVDSQDLRMYLACAEAFVFPSLYEGFGLPVLEAMSCGTPVLVSDRASIPEIVGEAGLYFDPTREEDCVRQLMTLAGNAELRHRLGREGLKRSRLFSWEKAGRQIERIYEELGG